MARPKSNNADYFSHDKNMRNDPKVKALRRKFKEGYAVYNMLLEVLTEANFFTVEITPLNIELLAGDFDVDTEILTQIIDYGITIQLFKREEDNLFSCGLKKRLQPVLDNRNRAKEGFLRQKQKQSGVSTVETTQSKVKYSKVNNVVVELIEETENFEKKIEKEVFIDEEEKIAAVEFLKKHSYFELVQKQFTLKPPEVFKLFDTFLNLKIADNALKGKTKDEIVKNFYYWIPKYQLANKPRPTNNGTSNNHSGRSTTTVASADAKRADRKQLVDSLRGLLRGTEPQ